MNAQYRHLKKLAHTEKRSEADLIKAFELESEFHSKILQEYDPAIRKRLYSQHYDQLHRLRERAGLHDGAADLRSKAKLVRLFRKELEGKSVLDVGCGTGTFLKGIDATLEHKRLLGIDLSPEILPRRNENVEFIQGDVIDFKVDDQFDVAFSDNVIEHIAPADLSSHLQSIKNALNPGGTLIVQTPNRLFGPYDVTRIIDTTYTNRVAALGGHLNETTYTELLQTLMKHGFSSFRTVIPIAHVKYYLPNIRLSPKFMQAIEGRGRLLSIMYTSDTLSVVFSRLLVVIICNNSSIPVN